MPSYIIDIVVYSKQDCLQCSSLEYKLNELLKDGIPIKWQVMYLNEDFTRNEIRKWFPDIRTYPYIVLNRNDTTERFSYDEFCKYLNEIL